MARLFPAQKLRTSPSRAAGERPLAPAEGGDATAGEPLTFFKARDASRRRRSLVNGAVDFTESACVHPRERDAAAGLCWAAYRLSPTASTIFPFGRGEHTVQHQMSPSCVIERNRHSPHTRTQLTLVEKLGKLRQLPG